MRNNTASSKQPNKPASKNGTGSFHNRKSSKVSTNSRDQKQNQKGGNVFSGNSSQEIMISDQNELNHEIQINAQITKPAYSKGHPNQLNTIPFQPLSDVNEAAPIKGGRNSIDHSEYVIDSQADSNMMAEVATKLASKSPDLMNKSKLPNQNSNRPSSKAFANNELVQPKNIGTSGSLANSIGIPLVEQNNSKNLSVQNISNIHSNKELNLAHSVGINNTDVDQDNLQDLWFLRQNLMINEECHARAAPAATRDDVMMDSDDCAGQLNNFGKAKKPKKASRNEAMNAHSSVHEPNNANTVGNMGMGEQELDELDESAKFTKVILPHEDLARKKQIQMQYQLNGQVGNMIGDYKVEKTLGQGTFGKVKQGYHIFTGQKVAIKILEKDKIDDTNDIERVAREIHILKIVRHPHIIHLYEIIETPTRLFLIMEHCCNGELFNYITSKNRLKEEEACRLFQQLISGIEYLGELGIAHRDIKPENLLLDEQKNLKIVDFGLSNTFKKNEKLMTACGSPCYAAPELIKGLEYVGQKADIWSTGVVLFCLVCGHLPFEDQNTQSLYQKILSADYQFTCYLSQDVQNLIQQILVPEPELRYGLKQIKQNAWMKIYTPPFPIDKGNLNGNGDIHVHKKLLKEMKTARQDISLEYAKFCILSNLKNNITSHYHLLVKKKTILQESLSEFSQLDMLDADADLQVAQTNKRNQLKNAIPIPGDRQVRAHHSIPAAPRHNIQNMEKVMNQQARYGYQLKKMNEGIANINIINQNQRDQNLNISSSMLQDSQLKQIIMPDNENGQMQIYRGQANVQAQRKNNAQMKVLGLNQNKKQKNGTNLKPQQVVRQQVRNSQNNKTAQNQILSPPNMQGNFDSINLNDYNGVQLQNNLKSNNSKKNMYQTQVTQSISNYQKRNNGQLVTMSPNKHASRKVVKGARQINNLNQSSNKAPRHSSQVGPVGIENVSVNRSLTYQQMGPIIGAINNSQNKTKASISQMSRMSGQDSKGNQQMGNTNLQTIQNTQKRQSVLTQYQSKFQTINNNKVVGTVKRQNLRQSGGRLINSSQNRINTQAFTTTQPIAKPIGNTGHGQMVNINDQNNATDMKKKQNFTTKSKLKKSFQEFQTEIQPGPQIQSIGPDQRQQILNQMLQKNDPQQKNVSASKGGSRVSKKHVRANSSANQYSSIQPLAPGLEASKSTAVHTQVGGQGSQINGAQNTITDGRVQRDQQNITNSIIISNSQILFQDMGNGKIMPMQLNNALGTIQPASSQANTQLSALDQPSQSTIQQNQSAMAQYQKRPGGSQTSHGGQVLNSKSNRQQRRKNAQSSRFNTLIQDYSDIGTGGLHAQDSITQMPQDYHQNRQKYQNQRNQYKGVSMSLGISKDQINVKQNSIQFQKKIPTVNPNLTGQGQRNITGQSHQVNSQAFQSIQNNKQSRKTTRANTNVMTNITNDQTRTPGMNKNLIPVAYKGTKNSRNLQVNTIGVNQPTNVKQEQQNRGVKLMSQQAQSANYSTQPMQQHLSLINQQEGIQNQPPQSEFLNNIDAKNQTQKNIQQNIQHINNKIYQMKIIGGASSKQGSMNNIPKAKSSSQAVNRKNYQNKSMDQGNPVAQQKKKMTEQHQRQLIKDNFLGSGQNYADPSGIHATLEPSRSMLAYQQAGQGRHGVNNSMNFSLNPSITNIGTTLQANASVNENMVRNLRMQKMQQKHSGNGNPSLRNSQNFNIY